MPELPEVEATRKSLKPLIGLTVIDVKILSSSLRYPIPIILKKCLAGKKLIKITRKGKYLLWEFDNWIMTSHLGMTGIFTLQRSYTFSKHDHILWNFTSKTGQTTSLVYNDTRRFGFIRINDSLQDSINKLKLGPDALSKDFTHHYFLNAIKNSKQNIKTILLNQSFVAGIGNIYASESLWYSGISPFRIAKNIKLNEVIQLIKSIKSVLKLSISANGTTLKDYQTASGEKGMYHNNFVAYSLSNTNCQRPKCTGIITRSINNGRVNYYCNLHQI